MMRTVLCLIIVQASLSCKVCELIGEDDIQGLKAGFLAGNKVFYSGGSYTNWNMQDAETIGLSHPFFHDLRARGTTIATYPGVGTGDDLLGWEWNRNLRVARADVVTANYRWKVPAPTHMYQRPDKVVVEYHLTAPGVQPVNITEEKFVSLLGSNHPGDVVSTIIKSTRPVSLEFHGHSFAAGSGGISQHLPDSPYGNNSVISLNGTCSFDSAFNTMRVDEAGTSQAKVADGGSCHSPGRDLKTVRYAMGRIMLDGMSAAISSSRAMTDVNTSLYAPETDGVLGSACAYAFSVPLDGEGTTVSWAMSDDYATARAAVREVLKDPEHYKEEKTAHVDYLFTDVVPYFNCSDRDVVKVYYNLWSNYLSYYTMGDQGTMSEYPHTQTAYNNFLGLHRWDSTIQIPVGSWTNPRVHDTYHEPYPRAGFANGNLLAWNLTMGLYRNTLGGHPEQLPDNFGSDWSSGCYGSETSVHIQWACQIYDHSGNKTFLRQAYDFYKELFKDGFKGAKVFNLVYDSVICLNKMEDILGIEDGGNSSSCDTLTGCRNFWNKDINFHALNHTLENLWEMKFNKGEGGTKCMYGDTRHGMGISNFNWAGSSQFPRDWTIAMAYRWLNDPVEGFNTDVPVCTRAQKDWKSTPSSSDYNFGVTPDTNWMALRGLFQHNVDDLATNLTVRHLRGYHTQQHRGQTVPVSPEARKRDMSLHGDQYSNFNAGKIHNILEGIGGLNYSVHGDYFIFEDRLPLAWDWMEFHVPVIATAGSNDTTWVKARAERTRTGTTVTKTVTVENNPFTNLYVEPWADDLVVRSSTPGNKMANPPPSHGGWHFNSSGSNVNSITQTVVLQLDGSSPDPLRPAANAILNTCGS